MRWPLLLGGNAFPLARLLVVSGGGGAGGNASGLPLDGAGGGGGARELSNLVLAPGTYTLRVGAGGVTPGTTNRGGVGGQSYFGTVLVTAGGGGGGYETSWDNGPRPDTADGISGGSGGGGGVLRGEDVGYPSLGGNGVPGEGFAGAGHPTSSSADGGGGGGAGGPGGFPHIGGPGLISNITGSSVEYAKGGGYSAVPPTGPGSGGHCGTSVAFDGLAGIIVLRYPGPQRITGNVGTVTTVSGDTVHTWSTVGTYVIAVA